MSEFAARIGSMENEESLPSRETELMSRLQRGDALAMEELVRTYGPQLNRLVGRLTAWHSDQEDILQEVLLVVWQRAGSFRGDGSLEGWLRRIAVNTCRNQQRADKSLLRMLKRFATGGGAKSVLQSDHQEQKEQAEEARAAMSEMNISDRTILVLYYLESLESQQIAAILGISTKTFHVKLHRARKRMEQILEKRSLSHDSHHSRGETQ